MIIRRISGAAMAVSFLAIGSAGVGQAPSASASSEASATCRGSGFFAGPAAYKSVEQLSDGRVTFRLCAPEATDARVTSSDIGEAIPMGFPPGSPSGLAMIRDSTGLWSATTAVPVAADTYRFNFQVNGARVPDPQGTAFSHERVGTNSTFEISGPEGRFQTYRHDVPHGVVSKVDYWSKNLGQKRTAYVYTPPGYMNGAERYPVLYLVHGAGDSADSWTSVGRANYILDNLLADGKAKPMIIVMPFGHTTGSDGQDMLDNAAFGDDLLGDLIPYIDASFRTRPDREHRAMAGLSMGGAHTIRFGLTRPDTFDYIGIFSMGLGMGGPEDIARYENANEAALRQGARDFDLVYYAMGTDDFLYGTVAPTRAVMEKYGIEHVYNESEGGHTWINWRRYLADFLPRLFE